MSKRKFPIVVKRGNVRVKIYATPSNGCDAFTAAYYLGGKRVRKTFADLGRAELEAETIRWPNTARWFILAMPEA